MTLEELYEIIEQRKKKMPKNSYVASLLKKGDDCILQKIGEEAIEVVIAGKKKNKKCIVSELADLFFHSLILLSLRNISLKEVFFELNNRHKNAEEV